MKCLYFTLSGTLQSLKMSCLGFEQVLSYEVGPRQQLVSSLTEAATGSVLHKKVFLKILQNS